LRTHVHLANKLLAVRSLPQVVYWIKLLFRLVPHYSEVGPFSKLLSTFRLGEHSLWQCRKISQGTRQDVDSFRAPLVYPIRSAAGFFGLGRPIRPGETLL
jgi:hypothetical protein